MPLLNVIDEVMMRTPKRLWPDRGRVATVLPKARRFILDEDASMELGKIIHNIEGLMLENHQFAIPPYEVTYVEMNTKLLFEAAGKPISRAYPDVPEDYRVGYLMHNGLIRTFTRTVDTSVSPGPFIFVHGNGLTGDMEFPKHGLNRRDFKAMVLLGTGVLALTKPETRSEILREWAIRPAFPFKKPYENVETFLSVCGELRNVIAALLVLNQPNIIKVDPQERMRGISRGKSVVFAAHNTVRIVLGKRKSYKRLFSNFERASPRRHEVRGHFVHYDLNPLCSHEWPTLPTASEWSGAPTWTCEKCGGRRTWRKAFERGDATVGFSTKDYEVVSQEETDVGHSYTPKVPFPA